MSRARSSRGRLAWMAVASCLLALAGCDGGRPGVVTVATSWERADREALEKALAAVPGAPVVRWTVLAPEDDTPSLARRQHPPDLLLGGPASGYAALEYDGVFGLLPSGRAWQPVRPGSGSFPPRRAGLPGFVLTTAEARLAVGAWSDGYAGLVRRFGAWPGAVVVWDFPPVALEGMALTARGADPAAARVVFEAFRQRLDTPPPPARPPLRPDAEALLADLARATLIEAQDELREAWSALEQAHFPERATTWLTTPPPWPPASVARIADDMPLLESLAAQLAPEADVRAWLLRSWLAPARTVDGVLLDELASAADGRLVREPRFRAWLRAEWTAWARQRYRRVARLSEWGEPPR